MSLQDSGAVADAAQPAIAPVTEAAAPARVPSLAGVRYGNFDVLRLIAATSVIFSHAFGITEGTEASEPMVRLLGPGNILGIYGVFVFFVLSGYLISQSFENSTLRGYIAKRCLRIFPGLIVCAAVTATLAVLAADGLHLHRHTVALGAAYFAKTALLFNTSDYGLPGLRFSDNDFGAILNGCVWTLGPEFACYIGVAVLGLLGLLGPRAAGLVLIVGLWTHATGALGDMGYLLPFFAAGVLMRALLERLPARRMVDGACAAGLVLGAGLGFASIAFAVFGSWLVLRIATARFQVRGLTRFGDLSYGLYLYGWPVEQSVRFALGDGAAWWQTFVLALPIAVALAYTSWHLIERPALALARRRAREDRQPAA